MKDTKDVVACVIDHGTFFPVAERLAREYKEVHYHIPNGDSFETFARSGFYRGHSDVKLCDDFWVRKKDFDLFVFPDIGDAGTQYELQEQGFPVWGSKGAGLIEKMREMWMDICEQLGMPMPKTHRIKGLTNLRLFLAEHTGEQFFVKISRWRGDMETWEVKPSVIQNKLDTLALKFGPFQEDILFFVQEPIDTDIEGGVDTFLIGNQFPNKIILGYEKKSQSYFATWKPREEMPPEIWDITQAAAPTLAQLDYCNFISSEVRVKGKKSWWLDPCFRCPSPAGEEQLEWYLNFPTIVWRGANGELEQPEMAAKYFGEAVIEFQGERDGWKTIQIPDEIKRWVKLYACGRNEDGYHYPPQQDPECIGTLVGMGDTPEEVLDHLKTLRDALKDEPVSIAIEPIADLFTEIESAEEQGIDFSEHEMPEPATVLEET